MSTPISNGLYGVPWGIGGGNAILQTEVARYLAYLMLLGDEGVMDKSHFFPSQLGTPGAGINLTPGGCAIINRSPGAGNQSYVGLAPSQVTLNVDPTTSTSRSDFVMIRVEDPYVSGNSWSVPGDVQDGPYIFPRVVYGVSSAAKVISDISGGSGWSAIPICLITRSANTGTIINAHITDLRHLVNNGPVSEFTNIVGGPATEALITSSTTSFIDWPVPANWNVPIPTWATHVEAEVHVYNANVNISDFYGEFQLVMGGVAQSPIIPIDTDAPNGPAGVGATGHDVWVVGRYYLSPSLRGTTVNFKTQAYSHGRSGTLAAGPYTTIKLTLKFKQFIGVA